MSMKSGEMAMQANDVEVFYVMRELELSCHCSFPFALKAALELRIPDILAESGPGASLTTQQIADKLPRQSHDAAQKVGRILRLLAHKGVFGATEGEDGVRYALSDVSRHFVTGSEFDLSPYITFMQRRDTLAPLNHLRKSVEDDAGGFELEYGADVWTYASAHPDFNHALNAGMRSRSKVLNTIFARHYAGFNDVKCLVDVGGGLWGAVAQIVARHPHIRGINFDLPHVIASAPEIAGVEHVAGNALESVPSGDTILLQQMLHDWGDEDCIKILKNCHKALPQNGRILIREHVIDPSRNSAANTGLALTFDIVMMGVFNGRGRERTSAEWKHLLGAAGFPLPTFLSVQELDLIEAVKA